MVVPMDPIQATLVAVQVYMKAMEPVVQRE
nr:MAG TPA: hypothetical protein [Caudoviricetes sp.]